ncbi:MAG: 2-amino-4-hydroxy-6-hydroxymethyldihydropteridine diphosphokinase [Muribaculaceae bacterium]|nr:2-amino-4-hydroxy-6-hydroxymethyldihydropteridine diphosphokinase [Muribaculaceae bacterium]
MNRATLCLGANASDADLQIARAAEMVYAMGLPAASTRPYLTEPEFAGDAAPYLNMIIVLDTGLCYEDVLRRTKQYQDETRRDAACAPFVAIDIDVVEWNGTVLRPADAASRYFNKGLGLLEKRTQDACDAPAAHSHIMIGECQ